MTISPCPDDGDARKRAALDLLKARRATLVRDAQRALLARLLVVPTATIDDVRSVVAIPAGIDPVAIGAAPSPLASRKLIRRVGYATTQRPEAHSRPVSVWALIDRSAAEKWLRDNPPLSAPPLPPGQRSLFGDTDSQQLPD